MALPTADREMPSALAASVKLPERAVVTKVTRPFKDSSGNIPHAPLGTNSPVKWEIEALYAPACQLHPVCIAPLAPPPHRDDRHDRRPLPPLRPVRYHPAQPHRDEIGRASCRERV